MKKLLVLAAISVMGLAASAQTEKGNVVLGGGVFYTTSKNTPDLYKVNAFSIMPNVGYFFADNVAAGLGLGYFQAKYDQRTVVNNSSYSTVNKEQMGTITPFVRYYKSVSDQFKFFGNLAIPFNFGTMKTALNGSSTYNQTQDNHGLGVVLSPGFAYFPTPKIGIEFSIQGISYRDSSYNYNTSDIDGGRNEFSIGANLASPTIGIQFYL